LAELEMQFREAIRNRGGGVEWRSAVDFPARFIAEQARCADIIVCGGHSPAFSDVYSLASPKDLVMQVGRPLLVVPDRVACLDLRSVMVAWKDTPEARRAVVDALPMLREAKEVSVIQLLEADEDRTAVLTRVNDVVAWLSRHSVSASGRVSEAGRNSSAAAQLDTAATEVGASLIVAGAYGHSRFRELILGGVTQYLVTQSARCVLLAR
jgi:nucleotide-binding universal stress UspA family protein